MSEKELRHAFCSSKMTCREEQDGGKHIEGYFVVYGQETELWDGCFEQIKSGAADASIQSNDIRAIFNHNTDVVLGRSSAGTLKIRSDEHGLYGDILINEKDAQAMDIWARVERGDISGCSFGFFPVRESYTIDSDGAYHWVVEEADINEISVCTFPAYPQTEITARKKAYEESTKRELIKRKETLKKRLEEIRNVKTVEN